MAFLDNFSKKITLAGQTAIQKTKEITDVARLHETILSEEKNIKENYNRIGMLYVELHADDYEDSFGDKITAIKESEIKIQNCRQQIKEIKGIDYCRKCGAEIPLNAAFCSSCGASVEPVGVNEIMMQCPNCGEWLHKGMKFCISCGEAVHEIELQDKASED